MHPAIPARWSRSRCGTTSSASPGRCRRGSPSPLRARSHRWTWSVTVHFCGRGRAGLHHDQVLPLVHARGLAGTDHGRAVELVEDRRPRELEADIEALALINRAVELLAVEPRTPQLAPGVGECAAGALELRHRDRRYQADAADAVGHDLDRFLRRHMAEHAPVLLVEADAQLLQVRAPDRFGGAGYGDLVALAGIAHIERPLDADAVGSEAVVTQLLERLCRKVLEHAVDRLGRRFAQRSELRADVV